MARVAQLEQARAALAAQVRGAEVGDAGGAEVVEALERRGGRAQHRPHEVRARGRRGEHVREQQSLGDLEPLLVGERPRVLGLQRRARGHEPGHALGRAREQLLEPQRPAAAVAQLEMQRVCVGAQEALARRVGDRPPPPSQVRRQRRGVAVELAGEGGLDGGHATPAGSGSSREAALLVHRGRRERAPLELVVGHAGRAYAPAAEPRPDVREQEARRDRDDGRDRERPDRVSLPITSGPRKHEDERHRSGRRPSR